MILIIKFVHFLKISKYNAQLHSSDLFASTAYPLLLKKRGNIAKVVKGVTGNG